ncbi:MAG: NAD(P)/FAD-dependent oxidoreductase [Sulfobacillus sp.]
MGQRPNFSHKGSSDLYDLVIVGAGVWGSSAALSALRQGAKTVLLLEADIGAAQRTSAKSGGIVTDLIWHEHDRQLVARSRLLFQEAAEGAGDSQLWQAAGMLTLGGPGHAALFSARRAELSERSIAVALMDRAGLQHQFPALDRLAEDTIALYTPQDWHVNPTAYAVQTVNAARRLGLEVRMATSVRRLEVAADSVRVHLADGDPVAAARVLVCAGTWSRKLLRTAGVDIALRPYRTQLSSVRFGRPHDLPIVWHLDTDLYLVPEGAQNMLAGDGTESVESDPETFRQAGDADFVTSVAERIVDLTSRGDGAGIRTAWAGLCGATPDRRPLLGRLAPHLYCACGDQGIGVMRGPALGELAAAVALEHTEVPELDPLRFAAADFPIRGGFTLEA